jgi:hypothetical protein
MKIASAYLKFLLIGVGLALIIPGASLAHAPNQSYIFVRIYENSIGGRFELTAKDLNRILDLNLKPGLTKDDVAPHLPKIREYLLEKTSFGSKDAEYEIRFTDTSVVDLDSLGDFVTLSFDLDGVKTVPDRIIVDYRAFFTEIPLHQAMLVIEYNWRAGIYGNESIVSLVFSRNNTKQELETPHTATIMQGFIAMIKLGIWHIWIGLDHILFLLALILPSVLVFKRRDGGIPDDSDSPDNPWRPVEKFKPALINVIKIVTCFTIAHTITLSLAALGIINLPSRLVESIIAISIALAALHNIRPVLVRNEWLIAFGFGLFHGFGFAGVLAEKGFGGEFMALTLLGFNLGVEIGQVFIICLMFPVLFLLRKSGLYRSFMVCASLMLILVAIYWFIERAFEIDLPLGGLILRSLGIL